MHIVEIETTVDTLFKFLDSPLYAVKGALVGLTISNDIDSWLETSTRGAYYHTISQLVKIDNHENMVGVFMISFVFEDPSDALLFKLTWA